MRSFYGEVKSGMVMCCVQQKGAMVAFEFYGRQLVASVLISWRCCKYKVECILLSSREFYRLFQTQVHDYVKGSLADFLWAGSVCW